MKIMVVVLDKSKITHISLIQESKEEAISHHLEQEIAPLTHPEKNKIMGHIYGPFKSYLFQEVR